VYRKDAITEEDKIFGCKYIINSDLMFPPRDYAADRSSCWCVLWLSNFLSPFRISVPPSFSGFEPIHGLTVLIRNRYICSKRREDITQPHDASTQRTWFLNTKTCFQITITSSALTFPVDNAATVQNAWFSESGTVAVAFFLSHTCYTSDETYGCPIAALLARDEGSCSQWTMQSTN
jgi:hypothetical protein